MEIRDTTRIAGLIGHPVSHSLSPAMHNAGFAACGIDARYEAWDVLPEDLSAFVGKLRDPKYLGANVTLPHKHAVIPFLDEILPMARVLGAVNTIVNRDGKLQGDTTDAAGFIAAFEDEEYSFDGKSVAILGSGGSARTIASALPTLRNVERIALVARDPGKAESLVAELNSGANISVYSLKDYAKVRQEYDIVVNTTPVGMHPAVDETPLPGDLLEPQQIIYDIVYNPQETRLLREAKARGCRVVGGLGMLVYQGKLSFEMWTGKNLPARVFLEGIRRHQQSGAKATP
jgi:shikimate dehydrogenase